MRRLADALGVHASTLYWHVPGKDALHDACVESVLARLDFPRPGAAPADWPCQVRAFMTAIRDQLRPHPSVIQLMNRAHPPGVSRLSAEALAITRAAGLDWPDAYLYARLLIWDIVGFVNAEHNVRTLSALHMPEIGVDGNPAQGRYRLAHAWPDEAPPEARELSVLVDVDAMFAARVELFVDGLRAVVGRAG